MCNFLLVHISSVDVKLSTITLRCMHVQLPALCSFQVGDQRSNLLCRHPTLVCDEQYRGRSYNACQAGELCRGAC
jgi:hypothetical protein